MKKPALVLVAALLGSAALARQEIMTTFNFDSDTPGQPPKGFEFGLTRATRGERAVDAFLFWARIENRRTGFPRHSMPLSSNVLGGLT